jgi:hypothetical protein
VVVTAAAGFAVVVGTARAVVVVGGVGVIGGRVVGGRVVGGRVAGVAVVVVVPASVASEDVTWRATS